MSDNPINLAWQVVGMFVVLFAAVTAVAAISSTYFKDDKTKADLAWYEKKILFKNGYTRLYGDNEEGLNYRLGSFDGGNNWAAIDKDTGKILGDVEDVYPGLLQNLAAWDTLSQHVQKNGPIDPTSPELQPLLNDAGITVTAK